MPPPAKTATPDSRAARKRARTRRAILDAARRLCAEQGHHSLTVAAIAGAADLGVGTLYYHFKTKDDVLVALMTELLQRVRTEIAAARATLHDPIARLRAGYAAFFCLTAEDLELLRVYYSSAAARADFTEAAREFFLQDTVTLIEAAQRTGAIRAGDPDLLARWTIGATSEAVQYLLAADAPFGRAAADLVADLVLHGLTVPAADRAAS